MIDNIVSYEELRAFSPFLNEGTGGFTSIIRIVDVNNRTHQIDMTLEEFEAAIGANQEIDVTIVSPTEISKKNEEAIAEMLRRTQR